jgi:uncharacterized protein YceH (UPF0502 family)
MDEEIQLELMYRFPGEDDYISLPFALDNLYFLLLELEARNEELRERVAELENKLTDHTIQAHH